MYTGARLLLYSRLVKHCDAYKMICGCYEFYGAFKNRRDHRASAKSHTDSSAPASKAFACEVHMTSGTSLQVKWLLLCDVSLSHHQVGVHFACASCYIPATCLIYQNAKDDKEERKD